MATPHINANLGDFAPTVLMPGDPLRAKFIADNFLDNVKEVNRVRNMFGYTGSYQGKDVSVMGSGMGIPSVSIYSKELYTEFNVENIIRVGSAGAVSKDIKIRDVVLAQGACTDSLVNRQRFNNFDFSAISDYGLLAKAHENANKLGIDVHVGNVFSADLFYTPNFDFFNKMASMQILCVEMEAAGLFGVAAECHKKALAILTISDHIITGEQTSSEEREKTFTDMMKIALQTS